MSRITRPSTARGQAHDADHGDHGDQGDGPDEVDRAPFVHTLTSAAAAGVHKPAGAAASVFEAGRLAAAAARPPRLPRTVAEPIDLQAIVIDSDIPVPEGRGSAAGALASTCVALLRRMAPGQSVLLPERTAKSLVRMGTKAGLATKRLRNPDGTVRVWRLEGAPKPRKAGSAAAGAATGGAV
jgi:hypothetical protein